MRRRDRGEDVFGQPKVTSAAARVGKYLLVRGGTVLLAVLIGIYLSVILINFGGFIDDIYRDRIENYIMGLAFSPPEDVPQDQLEDFLNETREELIIAAGLDKPFLVRSARWYWQAITFDWGWTGELLSNNYFGLTWFSGEPIRISEMVQQYFARSMLLFTAGNLVTFIVSVLVAMAISRQYGSWLDKLLAAFTPLSSAPNWIFGTVLVAIFAYQWAVLPQGGYIDQVADMDMPDMISSVARHMVLPVVAIFLSLFFQNVFTWRVFFMLNANEDYVDLGKAMGIPKRRLERNYIMKPTMPTIVTSFSIMLLTFWQNSMALEVFFDWPGIGWLFTLALNRLERQVTIAIIIVFAGLLGLTVLLLDFVYALVDPRVKISGERIRLGGRKKGLDKRVREFFSKKPGPRLDHRLKGLAISNSQASKTGRSVKPPRGQRLAVLRDALGEVRKFPSAVIGSLLILVMIVSSLIVVIAIPQEEAIRLWRREREETYSMPELARPVWTNWFRKEKLAETIVLSSGDEGVTRQVETTSASNWTTEITFTFDYIADGYPQDIKIKFDNQYQDKQPFIRIFWVPPSGEEIEITAFTATSGALVSFAEEIKGIRRTTFVQYGEASMGMLLNVLEGDVEVLQKGEYQVKVVALNFEEDANVEAELVILGEVFGMAGTDDGKRDLSVALLWGIPVALVFGLVGALLTSFLTMLIAAFGAWFGGWVDNLIQWITEINLMLPALPIAITVYFIYSKSIWVILGVMVLLTIFGSGIKNYRSVFIQVRDLPYVEAAKSYGATDLQIVFKYLLPKIYSLLIPQLVILVPAYVYLEATLSFLGVSGLYLPTWGKVLAESFTYGHLGDHIYWILQPVALLLITGSAFTMLGLALDRVLNPTLREL
jgi:peptide/nickel transport system permease protein